MENMEQQMSSGATSHPGHIGVYAAIAAGTIISLVGTFFMVQQIKIDEVGGRENYNLYKTMIRSDKFKSTMKESITSQQKYLNGENPDTPTAPVEPKVSLDAIKKIFSDGNIHFGSADSKVLIVEVSDPSCPFCHAAAGKNPELSKQMGPQFVLKSDGGSYLAPVLEAKKLLDEGKASFAYIYNNGHGNGELATQALYCAFEKGDFWEVHDKLMSNEGYDIINNVVKNDTSKISQLVDFIGNATDKKSLTKCLEDGTYEAKLASDQSLAGSLGAKGTPGFFVNDTKFSGAVNFTSMQAVVEAAMN